MKLVGFIKEYNDIQDASSLAELLYNQNDIQKDNMELINYLNKGSLLLAWMGYFIDFETKELIAPDSYYTDGLWVWPAYLPYYLKKYNQIYIDSDFISYLEEKNYEFQIGTNFLKNKSQFENDFANKLNGG